MLVRRLRPFYDSQLGSVEQREPRSQTSPRRDPSPQQQQQHEDVPASQLSSKDEVLRLLDEESAPES